MLPPIYLSYRRFNEDKRQEMDKKMGYAYTLHNNTFEANWEIVEEEQRLSGFAKL
jgi:hypothetical protein